MKKLLFAVLMSGGALLWLSSCGGETPADPAAKAQEEEAARMDSLSTTLDAAADDVEENTESLKKALDEL